jgi:cysteinyl-tRNA synthetase
MHGYFLELENAKMSKSSGDFLQLTSLADAGFDPLVYRYFCLTAHYRNELSFGWEGLEAAKTALNRLYEAAYEWGEPGEVSEHYRARFVEHLYEDLNVPRALAVTWELIRSDEPDAVKKATLLTFDEIFGLDVAAWQPEEVSVPEEVQQLVTAREKARQDKDWNQADALRGEILALGFIIEDAGNKTKIKPV